MVQAATGEPEVPIWDREGRPPTIAEWAQHIANNAPPLTAEQRATLKLIFAPVAKRRAGAA